MRPSPAEFTERWLVPSRPVILCGALGEAIDESRWSFEVLSRRAGATPVQVFVGPRLSGRRVAMCLAEAIDRMRGARAPGEEVAIRQLPLSSLPVEIASTIRSPSYCPADRRILPSLWISSPGTVQPFHQDHHHPLDGIANLLVQLHGRKHARLVSSEQDELMYRRSSGAPDGHFSEVDAEQPDLGAHPLFRQARVWEGTLAPGEALFIPTRWWHSLCALDESVSVSFWWRPHRLADLTAAALAAGSVADLRVFLEAHRRSVTLADVAEIGGVQALADGVAALAPPVARMVSVLLAPEVLAALAERRRAPRPLTRGFGRDGSDAASGRS